MERPPMLMPWVCVWLRQTWCTRNCTNFIGSTLEKYFGDPFLASWTLLLTFFDQLSFLTFFTNFSYFVDLFILFDRFVDLFARLEKNIVECVWHSSALAQRIGGGGGAVGHTGHFRHVSIIGNISKNGNVSSRKWGMKSFFRQRYWYFSWYDSLDKLINFVSFFFICVWNRNALFVPILKKCLLTWNCSKVHAVPFKSYRLKYWLLIGDMHLMHNFLVACTNRRTGWDARSVSIYGNASL